MIVHSMDKEGVKLDIRQRLHGILAYLPTPFLPTTGLPFDKDGFRANIRFLVDHGVKSFVPCGGTGEFWALSEDEWRIVVELARVCCPVPTSVIPAVGGSVESAIGKGLFAESAGCDGITVLPPPMRISEGGLVRYASAIAERVALPLMVYIPSPISIQCLNDLISVENVVAVKDTTGNLPWFRVASRAVVDRVNWVCEAESLAPYFLLHGAVAVTSGVVNFLPSLVLDLFESAVHQGSYARAAWIQRALDPWAELRAKPGNQVPVVKRALDKMGLSGGSVRIPLLPLGEDDEKEVDRLIGLIPQTIPA